MSDTSLERGMPLLDHLDELRRRLTRAAVAVVAASILALVFSDWIFDLLAAPYEEAVPDGDLAFFRPTEAFSITMRVALFGGVIIASPIVLYQAWRFVAPGLTKREKRWVVPIAGVFTLLFLAGVLLGYWSLKRGLVFLIDFGPDELEPVIGGGFYLSFAMRFILAFGIAFEFPVFIFAAAASGALTSARLRTGRRWAVVIILVMAALITPSGDPLTLMLLSTPLYVLYELTILAVRFILRR
ncbi:MAG: twin-arginine translocase subunit TatC [Acidimicrobiia bacterium]|nr:twin-arginine translocase subunit TatC [Acidimicrobiia bacterium]MBT8214891.1 twin-arginine translocase subunit TatC [Acidimicrobiia bacterium]NNF68647.1 twin-arginine translocase subunit TatC [Acidimicrobiia bacterium]